MALEVFNISKCHMVPPASVQEHRFVNFTSSLNSSIWWKDLLLLDEDRGNNTGWFTCIVKKCPGNGNLIRFWIDPWCGTISFNDLFPRLFNVSNSKEETTTNLLEWQSEDGWRWKQNWRHQLFD